MDVDIRFVSSNDGTGSDSDGPGGVIADAGYPSDGDIHFDDSELWTAETNYGKVIVE